LVLEFFREFPNEWLGVHQLAKVGGFAAWRTRVSEARELLKAEGGDVLWNKDTKDSRYMYRPHVAIGRDAAEKVEQKTLW
jgi:hypothetical protein